MLDKLFVLDTPSQRSSHSRPTPKGGGIAFVVAFAVAGLWFHLDPWILIPALCFAVLGFLGDHTEIHYALRLGIQIIITGALEIHWLKSPISPMALLLFLFWSIFIVGSANIYNFMDGINGIAGMTGVVAFGFLAFLAGTQAEPSLKNTALVVSVACLAFLPFNIPRAKLFMGDVGSLFLGFTFAVMTQKLATSFLDFCVLATLMFPFFADEITTIPFRLRRGENLGRPHRSHLYQILSNEFGIAHWKVSLGYALLQIVVAIFIITIRRTEPALTLPCLVILFFAFAAFTFWARKKFPVYL